VLAVRWLVAEVLARGPDALGYYVAPYRVMAKAIAWEMLLKVTRDVRTARNESELSVTLLDGSRIALRGADDPETLEGVGLAAVVCDEFARMKLDAWQKSLRPALSDKGGRALFCGKPRGFNHLKDFYERGQSRDFPAWKSWLFTTLDGGHVPAADVAEARSTLPAKAYRQEYEASWENAAGRVYEDFTRRTHVRPHAEIERLYKRDDRWQFRRVCVGVDWGYIDPGVAIVLGQTGAGDLVAVHEEYHAGRLVDEGGWLKTFRALRAAHPSARFVADPSEPGFITAARAVVRPAEFGGAQNDWREGHRRVATALLPKAHSKGVPGLLVSDRCPNLIREFEQHVFREVRGTQVEEPESGNDHALDALRYATMALTTGSGVEIF
jgi:hypothetical protein